MKNPLHRPDRRPNFRPLLSWLLCLSLGLALGVAPGGMAQRLRAEALTEAATATPEDEAAVEAVSDTSEAPDEPETTEPTETPEATEVTEASTRTATFAAAAAAPGAVQNFTAEGTGPRSILLRWTPNDSEFYALYRVTDDGLQFLTVVPGTRSTFEDRAAQPDTLNRYRVYGYALDAEGKKLFGPASAIASATPTSGSAPEEPIALDPVQGLRARAFASNSNNLRWTAHPEADAYAIFRRVGNSGPLEYVYYVAGDRLQFSDLHAPNEVFTYYWVFPVKHHEGQRVFGPAGRYVYARASRYLGMKALDGPLTIGLDPGLYDFEVPEGQSLTLRVRNAQGQTLSQQSLGQGPGQTPSLKLRLQPGDQIQLIGEGRVYCQKLQDGSQSTVDRSGLYYAGDDLGTGTYRAKLAGHSKGERGWVRLWDPLDPSKQVRPNVFSESLVSGVREAVEFTLRRGQILGIENLSQVILEWLR